MASHVSKTSTVTAPASWASALVNGDYSGLDAGECLAVQRWRQVNSCTVVDVERDENGEPKDAWFTSQFSMYGGTAECGDVLEYVTIEKE